MSISYLKIRIFVRDQGKTETQPAGILQYVEDLRRRFNTDIGRKDFFEMASSVPDYPVLTKNIDPVPMLIPVQSLNS
jgi:hypothetical protein